MVTVYAQASKERLTQVRAFLRESGIERPKLGRLGVRLQPHVPYITFTFRDERDATLFKFRFNDVKIVRAETIAEIEAVQRAQIDEGIGRLDPLPQIEATWRRNMKNLETF